MWIGEGVEIDDVEGVEGPAFIGDDCRIAPDASVGAYTVLASGVTLRERARVSRCVIDAGTYIGRSALVEGAILGRNCDVRSHVRVHEGVAIGDQVTLGEQSVIFPDVRIYPYKEVESGAHLHESLIWESRASTRLFGKDGVTGLVNVDLTPEIAVRLGAALGTTLKRGARAVSSRDAAGAYRMIKRAIIAGLNSAGVDIVDLRTLPAAVGKHLLNTQNYDVAFHVGESPLDPEMIRIQLFERPGISLSPAMQKEVDKHFMRQELRRVPYSEVGSISYPARARESYAGDLLAPLDADAIRGRGFRIVVDYGDSAASSVLPLVLGPLGVEAVTAHPFDSDSSSRRLTYTRRSATRSGSSRLSAPISARSSTVRASGCTWSTSADGRSRVDGALLLFLRLVTANVDSGRVAVPITVTSQVDWIVGDRLEIVRTRRRSPTSRTPRLRRAWSSRAPSAADTCSRASSRPTTRWRRSATCSSCSRRSAARSRSSCAELPHSTLVHREMQCSWALEGDGDARPERALRRPRTSTCSTGSRSSTSAAGCRCSPTRTSR